MNVTQVPQKASNYVCSNMNRVFGKHLLRNTTELKDIASHLRTEYVGSLPREIVSLVKGVSTTKEQKEASIRGIMEGFSQVADAINKGFDAIPADMKFRYWVSCKTSKLLQKMEDSEKIRRFLDKHPKITEKLYKYSYPEFYHKILKPVQEEGALPKAKAVLSEAFRKAGVMTKDEMIDIELLGGGMYSKTYKITFPERTGIKPKVLKVYKNKTLAPDGETYHGPVAENNAMLYVKDKCRSKHGFENEPFVEGYFGSLKRNYMVTEYAQNYRALPASKAAKPTMKVYDKHKIMMLDQGNNDNIIAGRNVDYGGAVNWGYKPRAIRKGAQVPATERISTLKCVTSADCQSL